MARCPRQTRFVLPIGVARQLLIQLRRGNVHGVLLLAGFLPIWLAARCWQDLFPRGFGAREREQLATALDTAAWVLLAAWLVPILLAVHLLDWMLRAAFAQQRNNVAGDSRSVSAAIPAGPLPREDGVPVARAVAQPVLLLAYHPEAVRVVRDPRRKARPQVPAPVPVKKPPMTGRKRGRGKKQAA